MKFYERLDSEERHALVLDAVAASSSMEGLKASRDDCLKELRTLERRHVTATVSEPARPETQ
jgi:hypothetical protein